MDKETSQAIRSIRSMINNGSLTLSGLTTTATSNLVAAINETQAGVALINSTAAFLAANQTFTGNNTFTKPLLADRGTALLPSYTFSPDLNTGFFSPGADAAAITTGGVQRVLVDANGRVSIGAVVTPTTPLDVMNGFRVTSSGGDWFSVQGGNVNFNANGGTTNIGNGGAGMGARLNIAPISDSIPLLSIRGINAGVSDVIRISAPTVATGNWMILKATGRFGFFCTAPGSSMSIGVGTAIGATYALSAAPTNGLMVEGDVLIGTTTSGSDKLTVVGTVKSTGLKVGDATNYVNVDGTGNMSFLGSAQFRVPTATPASSTAAGVAGTMCADANYIYVCTATNTWKRVAIATW